MPAQPADRDFGAEMSDLRPGDHLLGLFDNEEEQRVWVSHFVRAGLERGEKVLYLFDSHSPETILDHLRAEGWDPGPRLDSGQLSFAPAREAICAGNCFDPDAAIAALAEQGETAIAEEYTGLRITAEMTWCLSKQQGTDRYLEYECKSNAYLPESLCIVLCQYDRTRFTPHQLLEVLAIHPWVVSAEGRHRNLYYADPAHMEAEDPCGELLHGRLRRLQGWNQELRGQEAGREQTCALLDAIAVPVLALDGKARLTCLNRAAEATFGYASHQAEGKLAWQLLAAAEARPGLRELFREAVAEGQGEGEAALRSKGGSAQGKWGVALRRSSAAPVQVILTCWPLEENG